MLVEGRDPVAEATGVPIKVLANVGGVPMVERVLSTLEVSSLVETTSLVWAITAKS